MTAIPFATTFFDDDGDPASGALVNSYLQNTTTRTPVYTETTLTTASTNPHVCDAGGRGLFYVSSAINYDIQVTTADGATVLFEATIVGGVITVTFATAGNDTELVYAADFKTASNTWKAAIDLAIIAAQAALHDTVIMPSEFDLTLGVTVPAGVFLMSHPGGSKCNLVSSSNISAFSFLGTGEALTLNSTMTTPADRATFSAAFSQSVVGQIISFYDNGTGYFQAFRIRGLTSALTTAIFTDRSKFTVATGDASDVIELWSGAHEGGGLLGSWTFDGTDATGTNVTAYTIRRGVGMEFGNIHGINMHGSFPQVVGSQSGLADIQQMYDCEFGDHAHNHCGSANLAASNINQFSQCRFGKFYSDNGAAVAILFQRGTDSLIPSVVSGGSQARGAKWEYCLDVHVEFANCEVSGATSIGVLYGSRMTFGTVVLSKQRAVPGISSLVRTSNIVLATLLEPHGGQVGTVFAAISGATGADTFNVTPTALTIPSIYSFTFSNTGTNETAGGSPIFTSDNPTFWGNDTSCLVRINVLKIIGSNYTAGKDVDIGASDKLWTGHIVDEGTLAVSSTTLARINFFYEFRNGEQNADTATGILSGMTLSNNAGDATNDIDFAAGICADSTGAAFIKCSALTKRLDAVWAVGTAAGGLDTGAIANGTYHCFAIKKDSTGVGDFLFSASATAPTMPTGYTYFRRIGSIIRASAALRAFTQLGDEFLLKAPVQDSLAANPGVDPVSATLTTPVGIQTTAIFTAQLQDATPDALTYMYVSALDQTASAPDATNQTHLVYGSAGDAALPDACTHVMRVRTSTTPQIRYELSASTGDHAVILNTLGWIDTRGR